jgi:hypothetical protein
MSLWCNHYNCWCTDVDDITDGEADCDSECSSCEYSENIKQK